MDHLSPHAILQITGLRYQRRGLITKAVMQGLRQKYRLETGGKMRCFHVVEHFAADTALGRQAGFSARKEALPQSMIQCIARSGRWANAKLAGID